MQIKPIIISAFTLNNNINNNQNKVSAKPKSFESYDTFTLSFGKKDKPAEKDKFNYKKEYKKIKKLIDNRDDFSPHEKKLLKWTIKYDYDTKNLVLLVKKGQKDKKYVPGFNWHEQVQKLEDDMKDYTNFIGQLLQNKRVSAEVIDDIHLTPEKEYRKAAVLLANNENFPPEKIASFLRIARDHRCRMDEVTQMIEDGETSSVKLIKETATRIRKEEEF